MRLPKGAGPYWGKEKAYAGGVHHVKNRAARQCSNLVIEDRPP